MKNKKLEKPDPKAVFKIVVRKMMWDWWTAEGNKSMKRFIRKNFNEYFEVK